MVTGLLCGFGLLIAAGLFRRELRLWRSRDDLEGVVFRYSRGRFLRRLFGCALLAINMIMVFLALEVIDWRGHLGLFQAWWGIIAVSCVGLLVLPFLDLRETYKHVTRGTDEKMRAELERITAEAAQRAARMKDRGQGKKPG